MGSARRSLHDALEAAAQDVHNAWTPLSYRSPGDVCAQGALWVSTDPIVLDSAGGHDPRPRRIRHYMSAASSHRRPPPAGPDLARPATARARAGARPNRAQPTPPPPIPAPNPLDAREQPAAAPRGRLPSLCPNRLFGGRIRPLGRRRRGRAERVAARPPAAAGGAPRPAAAARLRRDARPRVPHGSAVVRPRRRWPAPRRAVAVSGRPAAARAGGPSGRRRAPASLEVGRPRRVPGTRARARAGHYRTPPQNARREPDANTKRRIREPRRPQRRRAPAPSARVETRAR